MTLTTRIRVNHPVNAMAAFDYLTMLVGGDPETVRRTTYADPEHAITTIHNNAAQGLGALLEITWGEGPLPNRWEEEDLPPALVEFSMDSPYAFHDPENDWDCTAWHMHLIGLFAPWLIDQGVPFDAIAWQDEYTGEWHDTMEVAM